MSTTQEDIRGWLERGKAQGATHLIVICDTYDWEDYPVFVGPDQDVRQLEAANNGGGNKVMEVYRLSMDWDVQLAQHRAFNY